MGKLARRQTARRDVLHRGALRRILDLTSHETLEALKFKSRDLHMPWRGADRLTVTQLLGETISEHRRSFRHRRGCGGTRSASTTSRSTRTFTPFPPRAPLSVGCQKRRMFSLRRDVAQGAHPPPHLRLVTLPH